MRRITDSSRTHGTQPASEDSMRSAGLGVRPFPPAQFFLLQLHFVYLFLLNPIHQSLKRPTCASFARNRCAIRTHYTWGLLYQKLNYKGLMPSTCVKLPHVPFIHHYMHRYDLSFGQAGLPGSCAYPYVPDCSARR